MKVSVKEWLQTGDFGLIRVGMSREQVQEILGQPEVWDATSKVWNRAKIWKYGDFEFHFDQERLWMIFADDFDVLSGGRNLELDVWILRRSLELSQARQELSAASIAFSNEEFSLYQNSTILVCNSGVRLTFIGEDRLSRQRKKSLLSSICQQRA